jgi:FkbH-like protein
LVLRWEDFAATRINWGPKSTGIREMAEELNLGLDAFVFLDDNPLERAEVRQMLPQVKVIEHEPWGSMRDALANCPWFDTLSLVEEDRVRAHLYTQDRQRQQAQSNFGTVEEFLRDLAMVVEVGEVQAAERGRVAQLIKKTNQFNLTGRRHSEAALAAWGEPDSGYHVAYLRLRDRFGDQGLIAAAILRRDAHRAHIDTFLMSCRVMNRHVEYALLSHLASVARAWGCEQLTGEYIASPRNQMVSGFYASAGFTVSDGDAVLALRESDVPWPVHIARAERG